MTDTLSLQGEMNIDDSTIVAIATPLGKAGIGIIRLSGKDAVDICRHFLNLPDLVADRYVYLRQFRDFFSKRVLDKVCFIYFKSPKSYTGEDVVEIQSHSSSFILNRILENCVSKGAKLAGPGEFTKRAFIHGKVSLSQAESVVDLLDAQSEQSHQVAISHCNGFLSQFIDEIRYPIQNCLEQIEGSIDFPEEVPALDRNQLKGMLEPLKIKLERVIQIQDYGSMVMDGVNCLFIGKPNVGKSSLFNQLLKQNRSIVTEIPGTTRDFVDASFLYKGLHFKCIDSAGVRFTENLIEKAGIDKGIQLIDKSDCVCFVIDQSQELNDEDFLVFDLLKKHSTVMLVKNKSDKDVQADCSMFENQFPFLECCALTGKNIDILKEKIYQLTFGNCDRSELNYLCNIRQVACLKTCLVILENILTNAQLICYDDLLCFELKKFLQISSELNGDEITEDVLDGIFSRFCVGK